MLACAKWLRPGGDSPGAAVNMRMATAECSHRGRKTNHTRRLHAKTSKAQAAPAANTLHMY